MQRTRGTIAKGTRSIMKGSESGKYKHPVASGATCGDIDDSNRQANRLGGICPVGECLLGVR